MDSTQLSLPSKWTFDSFQQGAWHPTCPFPIRVLFLYKFRLSRFCFHRLGYDGFLSPLGLQLDGRFSLSLDQSFGFPFPCDDGSTTSSSILPDRTESDRTGRDRTTTSVSFVLVFSFAPTHTHSDGVYHCSHATTDGSMVMDGGRPHCTGFPCRRTLGWVGSIQSPHRTIVPDSTDRTGLDWTSTCKQRQPLILQLGRCATPAGLHTYSYSHGRGRTDWQCIH
ncbi:hypothetical protein HDK77DRAFT_442484 [Phyllosticta capitalensis]